MHRTCRYLPSLHQLYRGHKKYDVFRRTFCSELQLKKTWPLIADRVYPPSPFSYLFLGGEGATIRSYVCIYMSFYLTCSLVEVVFLCFVRVSELNSFIYFFCTIIFDIKALHNRGSTLTLHPLFWCLIGLCVCAWCLCVCCNEVGCLSPCKVCIVYPPVYLRPLHSEHPRRPTHAKPPGVSPPSVI